MEVRDEYGEADVLAISIAEDNVLYLCGINEC